jgi:hypothetical protein
MATHHIQNIVISSRYPALSPLLENTVRDQLQCDHLELDLFQRFGLRDIRVILALCDRTLKTILRMFTLEELLQEHVVCFICKIWIVQTAANERGKMWMRRTHIPVPGILKLASWLAYRTWRAYVLYLHTEQRGSVPLTYMAPSGIQFQRKMYPLVNYEEMEWAEWYGATDSLANFGPAYCHALYPTISQAVGQQREASTPEALPILSSSVFKREGLSLDRESGKRIKLEEDGDLKDDADNIGGKMMEWHNTNVTVEECTCAACIVWMKKHDTSGVTRACIKQEQMDQ